MLGNVDRVLLVVSFEQAAYYNFTSNAVHLFVTEAHKKLWIVQQKALVLEKRLINKRRL